MKLATKHLDNPATLSIVTSIFSHARGNFNWHDSSIDITGLVAKLLEALKGPRANPNLFYHAMSCFLACTYQAPEKCERMPSFVSLLAALLHSKDPGLRNGALFCLENMNLYKFENEDKAPDDKEPGDARVEKLRGTRTTCCGSTSSIGGGKSYKDLKDAGARRAVERYGEDRLLLTQLRRAHAAYTAILVRHNAEPDLPNTGRDIACLIYDYKFALPEPMCPCCGAIASCADCCSRRSWPDFVQKCLRALREQDSPTRQDLLYADILEWRLNCNKTTKELYDFCQSALKRNPQCPLFYCITPAKNREGVTMEDCLKMAKKGLKCPDIPQWLRLELTTAAVYTARGIALRMTSEDPPNAYAWLASARSDAKRIMEEGPPDDLKRCHSLSTYMLSHIAIEGIATSFRAPTMRVSFAPLGLPSIAILTCCMPARCERDGGRRSAPPIHRVFGQCCAPAESHKYRKRLRQRQERMGRSSEGGR